MTSINYSNSSYGYRSDGLRAWRQRTISSSTQKRYYLYDHGNAVMEIDSSGAVQSVNVFAPDGLASRHWSTSSHHYYLFDWQGNVAQRMTSSTAVGVHFGFNAWGQMNYRIPEGIAVTDDWNNVWAYSARWGYQYDQATGFYYCQQRYYDPANGRWVTRFVIRAEFESGWALAFDRPTASHPGLACV